MTEKISLAWVRPNEPSVRLAAPPEYAIRLIGALLALAVAGVHVAAQGGTRGTVRPGQPLISPAYHRRTKSYPAAPCSEAAAATPTGCLDSSNQRGRQGRK